MQNTVSGRLAGMAANKITIQLPSGENKVYPRGDLKKTLQWVFENMGKPLICLLKDGVVEEIKSSTEAGNG